jgi:hypothetical protein
MRKPVSPENRTEEVSDPERDLKHINSVANVGIFAALIGGLLFGALWLVGDRYHIDLLLDISLFGFITCGAVFAISWLVFIVRVATGK